MADLPEPLYTPEVPKHAERLRIQDHIRYQYHPLLLNAIGGPLEGGPRELLGIDIRCVVCKHIQPLCSPGQEGACEKCDLRYKYTVVKNSCWLWIWRPQEKLDLDGAPNYG